jgi:hypothetical protein
MLSHAPIPTAAIGTSQILSDAAASFSLATGSLGFRTIMNSDEISQNMYPKTDTLKKNCAQDNIF